MSCKEIVDELFKIGNHKNLLNLYKKLEKKRDKSSKYFKYLFFKPIEHFIKKLDKNEQNKIIQDLKNPKKMEHWMWWGFPQKYDSWGKIKVSETTKQYALMTHQGILFLIYFHKFYFRILKKISTKKNLLEYFGNVDFIKFKSHLSFFHIIATKLKYSDVLSIIQKLNTKLI
jgi:uncharacterized protein (DUF1810 family)